MFHVCGVYDHSGYGTDTFVFVMFNGYHLTATIQHPARDLGAERIIQKKFVKLVREGTLQKQKHLDTILRSRTVDIF